MSAPPHIVLELALRRKDFALELNLSLPAIGFTVLYGSSGAGKTTLLRCVAGLERAQGLVHIAGEDWQNDVQRIFKPTWQRALGYVFQEASLFSHLSVEGNLRFGLRRVKNASYPLEEALEEAVALLGIASLRSRRVETLSGGERQRVAIARALALRPQILLMDEPLTALDARRKAEILPWLEKLQSELAIPVLYVTHHEGELKRLANHVVVLEEGKAVYSGSPESAPLSGNE